MTNVDTLIKSLLIWAVALPIAVVIGYLLPTAAGSYGMDLSYSGPIGIVLMVIVLPLLLKWHHWILILAMNMSALVFFLPGRPQLWMVMAFVSLGIFMVQRAIDPQMRFLHAPSVTLPLVVIALFVLFTAKMTGGMGVRVFGSEAVGGKRYLALLAAIVAYFALTCRPIPKDKAALAVALFFLGGLTNAMADALPLVPQPLWIIFLLFPVDKQVLGGEGPDVSTVQIGRYYGLSVACMCFCFYLLARYGARGVLGNRKRWVLPVFAAAAIISMFGGFRSFLILTVMTCVFLFWFEGLARSRYLPILLGLGLITGAAVLPFANKLPSSIQRALSFLPVDIDPVIRRNAEASSEWRVQIWQALLPEVPKYFWLGKGLGIASKDLELTSDMARGGGGAQSAELAVLAGDYHNGPLSLLIPFGIFCTIAFVWFLLASTRVLYLNYRNGDPDYGTVNALLLSLFLARIILFLTVFGGFYGDMLYFCGIIGFSIALNGGIRKAAVRAPSIARPVTLTYRGPARGPAGVPAFPRSAGAKTR